MSHSPRPSITGVILAGGRGQRFSDADKGLMQVDGRPLIKRVLERLLLQVDRVLIVANRNQEIYSGFGHRIISDTLPHFQGPLAGIAAGLQALETSHALFVPVDAARLPTDLAAALMRAHLDNHHAPALVRSADGPLPVCCLLRKAELLSVEEALACGERSVLAWLHSRHAVEVDFSDWPAAFWSLNTPQERAALELALSSPKSTSKSKSKSKSKPK
jgi:molybdopterin-guanine dinucleotide biosynthesis protein A